MDSEKRTRDLLKTGLAKQRTRAKNVERVLAQLNNSY